MSERVTPGRCVFVAVMGAFLAAATTARGQEGIPAVPSGLVLTLQEVLEDPQPDGQLWLRLRYVAPDLAPDNYASVEEDFAVLCSEQALTYAGENALIASQAVISIASATVEFGSTAPDVTQFFEAFRLENGACIWEAF
ncbi:DUF6497 family protein [Pseudooceanicola atlanticus]|uniref:DUF6497 family protein n=1 Tax=Pseudooceanicola atlanticus TaxID=1461694 RepID=UPI0005C182A7|nr:DUF6497 family protein [Pseudooceanicola atlanticus]